MESSSGQLRSWQYIGWNKMRVFITAYAGVIGLNTTGIEVSPWSLALHLLTNLKMLTVQGREAAASSGRLQPGWQRLRIEVFLFTPTVRRQPPAIIFVGTKKTETRMNFGTVSILPAPTKGIAGHDRNWAKHLPRSRGNRIEMKPARSSACRPRHQRQRPAFSTVPTHTRHACAFIAA